MNEPERIARTEAVSEHLTTLGFCTSCWRDEGGHL